jgi:hypothetical protein
MGVDVLSAFIELSSTAHIVPRSAAYCSSQNNISTHLCDVYVRNYGTCWT